MKENMLNQQIHNIKKYTSYCIIIVLSSILSGCDLKEEKSYEYYALHPEELRYDYNYCEKHPSSGVCINIVKKYFYYKDRHKSGVFQFNNPDQYQMSTGYIFRNMDEPINTFGSSG